MRRLSSALCLIAVLPGCSATPGPYPSLQPRAAESVDPRLPVAALTGPITASADLTARLSELTALGRSGNAAFAPAMAAAERLSAGAGAPRSESWIAAQQALSAASAARAVTVRALGDIDAIGARRLEERQTLSPADLAAIQEAASVVGAIDRAQQARLMAVARRLGI